MPPQCTLESPTRSMGLKIFSRNGLPHLHWRSFYTNPFLFSFSNLTTLISRSNCLLPQGTLAVSRLVALDVDLGNHIQTLYQQGWPIMFAFSTGPCIWCLPWHLVQRVWLVPGCYTGSEPWSIPMATRS